MPKPSALATQYQAKKAAQLRYIREVTLELCEDAAVMAANEVFHRRGEILAEFAEVFSRTARKLVSMTVDDAKADKTLEYTQVTIDTELRELLGDAYRPWAVRHKYFYEPESKR